MVPTAPVPDNANDTGAESSKTRIRVKTLQDQSDGTKDDAQTAFYNGNALSFEPRKKDDEDG